MVESSRNLADPMLEYFASLEVSPIQIRHCLKELDCEEDFKCVICLGIVFEPTQCESCSAIFCKTCID